jgi:hypothetical protein
MAEMSSHSVPEYVTTFLDCARRWARDRDARFTQLHGGPLRCFTHSWHPSAQDDVGTIAAKAQTANAQAEGFGELSLMETLCPFQLFYSDSVEWLGAESARERVRWVSAIW